MKEITFTGFIRPQFIRAADDESRDILRNLYKGLQDEYQEVEVIVRVWDPQDLRKDWIDLWYMKAINRQGWGGIIIRHCKDATFVYENDTGICASAAPRHGDKYDYKTGIAVAYAKVMDEPIPDYI